MKFSALSILSGMIVMLMVPLVLADDTYYAQVGFYHEKGKHLCTNYQKGNRVSVNTPVKLLSMDSKKIKIVLIDTGETITLVNTPSYTKATAAELFDRMFDKNKVNMSVYSEKTQRNIKLGTVVPGMTKKTVIRTLGYPPAHETASTDMDRWTYWLNRFNRLVVNFSDGKVISVEN